MAGEGSDEVIDKSPIVFEHGHLADLFLLRLEISNAPEFRFECDGDALAHRQIDGHTVGQCDARRAREEIAALLHQLQSAHSLLLDVAADAAAATAAAATAECEVGVFVGVSARPIRQRVDRSLQVVLAAVENSTNRSATQRCGG